ncbi:MAG TPA: hypothetical protein VGG78_07415 [Gemmatimonadaceae bacterium]|jgi:hypothetical protein
MTQPDSARNDSNTDLARVTEEIAGRLRARGVSVSDRDSPDDVVRLLEAVEAFERAVESHGGDLMVDEPPARSTAQPDDPHFLLPTRADDETLTQFNERLWAATAAVRGHRRH